MVRKIDNEERAVHIAFSPNGKFLLTGNVADIVKVYDLDRDSSIAKIGEFKARCRQHRAKEWCIKIEPRWSPSGNHILSRWNKNLQIWAFDGQTLTEETPIGVQDDVSDITFSPDGRYLAVAAGKEKINTYNWETRTLMNTYEGCSHAVGGCYTVKVNFSPNSAYLAFRWKDDVRIVGMQSGNIEKTIKFGTSVSAIVWHPKGHFMCVSEKKASAVYDMNNCEKVKSMGAATYSGSMVQTINPVWIENRLFARWDKDVRVWKI
jgi:WD40 repeat protein